MGKIEFSSRGGTHPLPSLLLPPAQPRCPGPAGHQARLVKAAVNEITSTSPAKAIICFREAI